jgi:Sec1 family
MPQRECCGNDLSAIRRQITRLFHEFKDHAYRFLCYTVSGTTGYASLLKWKLTVVMVIVDRNLDLIPMISHSWTYQSLVSEVLSMKLNRIVIETTVDGKTTRKGYDIDSEDFFWKKNAPHPFPQVAEGISSAHLY